MEEIWGAGAAASSSSSACRYHGEAPGRGVGRVQGSSLIRLPSLQPPLRPLDATVDPGSAQRGASLCPVLPFPQKKMTCEKKENIIWKITYL